jgi:CheY-like chemotaxis protein
MSKRILIADDEASVRSSLASVLELEGYETLEARNGREVIARLRQEPCDLLLLDLSMPGLDGWRALDAVSKLLPLLPVIVITARPNQYPRAVGAAVDALMEKPLDLPVLLRAIADLLQASEADRIARLISSRFKTAHLSLGPPPVASAPA